MHEQNPPADQAPTQEQPAVAVSALAPAPAQPAAVPPAPALSGAVIGQAYPANGHHVASAPAAVAAPGYYAAPPGLPPALPPSAAAAVPPTPPTGGRGAGFWVGIIAAATALAVMLVLGGFFIGRSSRLSDGAVRVKINQQRQADQIAQTRALQAQADEMRHDRVTAVRSAADRARAS